MKNIYWIAVGFLAGAGAGALYGFDYAIAGAVIGIAGGAAIYLVMRNAKR